jgi:GNAT superfamily N-acetyltransferase
MNESSMNKITQVTRAEIPDLLELIRELARFEKLEQEVVATVGVLENSLFGPQPAAGALLGRCDGKLAGYAIYFFTFSSFIGRPGIWLEDVYVRPEFRKRGLGLGLIQAVARAGVERNCGRFEWTALNWNTRALDFYDKMGARKMDEWIMLRMNEGQLRGLGGSI